MSNFSLNLLKYEDVRSEIVDFLKTNSEFSGQFDFTASNMGLIIDTMAYISMMMAYQLSNTTNNMFLDSTVLRKNALSITKTMGYRPQRSIASKVTGTIEYYSTTISIADSTITIPAYTSFISDTGYTYINYDPIVLTPDVNDIYRLKANVILYEGTLKSYTYLGNGLPFQTFTIPSSKVDENHFELKVRKNNEIYGGKWTEIIKSFNMLDKKSFFVEEDINTIGHVKVSFGDNEISDYPGVNEIVDVQYLETNADLANNSTILYGMFGDLTLSGSLTVDNYNRDNFINITNTLSRSYGGTPIETLEIIKERAPKSFVTVGRAVTQNDYQTLMLEQPYVTKANAIGGDTLYPNQISELGNIYLSAIPFLNEDFFASNTIYLPTSYEIELLNTFNRYKIISTELIFIKPSYIHINITPEIEIKPNSSSIEINTIKTNVNNALSAYAAELINFSPTIRESKINSVISEVSGVLSSSYTTELSFALTRESLYYPNTENNMLYLPVMIKTRNELGDVIEYTNFIRTNEEQATILGKNIEDLEISERTIYGRIYNGHNERYLYNEDNIPANSNYIIETCDIKIDGHNKFFRFFRNNMDLTQSVIDTETLKQFTFGDVEEALSVTMLPPVVSGDYTNDSFELTLNERPIGTVKRTFNREHGYKGLIYKEEMITSTTQGDFYKVSADFDLLTDKVLNTTSLLKDDIIIYDSNISKWVKAEYISDVSAANDSALFNKITEYSMYNLLPGFQGDFNGKTPLVSYPDTIIFKTNGASASSWEKLNPRSDYTFDASTPIVKEAVPWEIKKIVNLGFDSTNFGGRYPNVDNLFDGDLIYYYDEDNSNTWIYMGNTNESVIYYSKGEIVATPYSGGALDIFIYDELIGNVAIGDTYIVRGIGNFGTSSSSVNWPSSDETAYDGDILLYIGNGRWNIWQDSCPDVFNINGKVVSALPIKMSFGDKFKINTSGDFVSSDENHPTYLANDYVVYTGNDTWVPYAPNENQLDPTGDNLPQESLIGEMYTITTPGSFLDSYLISPQYDTFVEGDVIIFNGNTFTKVNEYTFEYNDSGITTGREFLNELGFNYVFKYDYDGQYFNIYFNDKFHGSKIGTFRYCVSNMDGPTHEVGKLIFDQYTTERFDDVIFNDKVNIQNIFDSNTINKISFLPKNKLDVLGNISNDPETNFETLFNTFVILNSTAI